MRIDMMNINNTVPKQFLDKQNMSGGRLSTKDSNNNNESFESSYTNYLNGRLQSKTYSNNVLNPLTNNLQFNTYNPNSPMNLYNNQYKDNSIKSNSFCYPENNSNNMHSAYEMDPNTANRLNQLYSNNVNCEENLFSPNSSYQPAWSFINFSCELVLS